MSFFQITNRSLPGIRGYIRRNPVFRQTSSPVRPSADELVRLTQEALRAGQIKTGDEFPIPGEMARETGATIFDCLEAVGVLLKGGSIQQDSEGRLSVAPNEEYTVVRSLAG
jgi:ApbE superfamily uncharacterized protein (UPF0280 family)